MKRILMVCCGFLAASTLSAQTSFPMITHTQPVAIQRGQTTEISVDGQQNFFGAYQVLFEGTGLAAEIVSQMVPEAVPGQKPLVKTVKLKVTAAQDARLGVREFRIATSLGISSIGQLLVVDDPVLPEQPKNDTRELAQTVKLPCVLAGRLEAVEDVDYFQFEAREGETLTFELFCARLQDKIHDLQKHAKPMLILYDAEGRELAANDTFYFADPMLSYTVSKTGRYFIQVRESTYDGDPRWVYALLATNKPYASHLYPLAGNPGKKIEVEAVGSAGARGKVPFQVPETPGLQQVQISVDGQPSNPVSFLVSPLPQVLEQEPNNEPEQATRAALPAGINGKIQAKRDMDYFVFHAPKGKAIRLEMKARRFGTLLNSSLHGVLEVMNSKGVLLASNDDSHGKEAALIFTPPADGDYLLRIRDLNSKGGPSFIYHVEADWATPDFTLRVDPDKAMIGPGSSTAWYVHVVRTNGFAEPVQIQVKGLPTEMTASPLTIPPSMTQGVLVLTANPSAGQQANFVEIFGAAVVKGADGKETTLVRKAVPNQEIYFPGGGRGKFDVNTHVAAVTDPSDILKVNTSVQEIVLKPGQEVKIDVELLRRPDFDKGVTLDVLLAHLAQVFGNPLPPGVTVVTAKSKTLLGAGSKGHIVLKADAKAAPIERVPISVLAHVSINFVVKVSYSSPVIWLTVRKD